MLKQLFIKDYKDTENPVVRARYGLVAGVFGIVSNILLCAIKMLVGLLAGSITIVADAVNNLTDAGSSVLTIIGFKLSNKPADSDHPYGHARYENVTALIVALLVFAVGVLFLKTCIEKIITPEEVELSALTFIILGVAIVGKGLQMFVYLNFAKAIDSDALRASAADTRNDILSTSATLIAMVIISLTGVNVDAYAGLLVSLFILFSSVKMIAETVDPLLGVKPDRETVTAMRQLILKPSVIRGVHDLMIHDYGSVNRFASAHVEVDKNEDVEKAHDVIDNVERECFETLGVRLTLHYDPIDYDDEDRKRYAVEAEKTLLAFDNKLTFHDFRVVKGDTHTNVVFDVVEPFGHKIDVNELKQKLKADFKKAFSKERFYFVIEVDADYAVDFPEK